MGIATKSALVEVSSEWNVDSSSRGVMSHGRGWVPVRVTVMEVWLKTVGRVGAKFKFFGQCRERLPHPLGQALGRSLIMVKRYMPEPAHFQ